MVAGRTRIPAPAAGALLVVTGGPLMLLGPARLLLRATAGTLLRTVRLGLNAALLLLRPDLAIRAGTLMTSVIAIMAAAARPLFAIAAWSVLLRVILRLAWRGIGSLGLLTLAILVGPRAALAAVTGSLRTAVMRASAGSTFGPLKLRLGPAEAPDFLEAGLGALALRSFVRSLCCSLCTCGRIYGRRGRRLCGTNFASSGSVLFRGRRDIVVRGMCRIGRPGGVVRSLSPIRSLGGAFRSVCLIGRLGCIVRGLGPIGRFSGHGCVHQHWCRLLDRPLLTAETERLED